MYYGYAFISFHSSIRSFILALLLLFRKMVHGPMGWALDRHLYPLVAFSAEEKFAFDFTNGRFDILDVVAYALVLALALVLTIVFFDFRLLGLARFLVLILTIALAIVILS